MSNIIFKIKVNYYIKKSIQNKNQYILTIIFWILLIQNSKLFKLIFFINDYYN